MRETFAWIRRNTPPTRFFDDPAQKPEYGVIYESDKSIWLLFYAHRPIVGAFWDKHAIDPFKFYMAESEDEANEICDRTQTRYVVAYPIIFYSLDYAEIAGKDPNRYMLPVKKASDGEPVFRPTDRYWHLIGERLSRWDGVSPWEAPGSPTSLQRYRLVHESEPFTDIVVGNPASLKVFEYVKGARIVGHTMPRAAVRADVSMVTNRNRSYLYTTQGRADERGKFVLTVPYATTPALSLEPSTRSVSTYRISSLGLDAFTGVTEDDVLQGYEVPVAFRAP
jgi:dolichyl-diphosphooligosaccharide--protein glycosyltransferase